MLLGFVIRENFETPIEMHVTLLYALNNSQSLIVNLEVILFGWCDKIVKRKR